MGRRLLLLVGFFILGVLSVDAAEQPLQEIHVLDHNTFVMLDQAHDGANIIQLYKVDGNRLELVDAVEVTEKLVNFKPLLEYRKLKIEQK